MNEFNNGTKEETKTYWTGEVCRKENNDNKEEFEGNSVEGWECTVEISLKTVKS